MTERYVLALDAGTTSSRAILFDAFGSMAGTAQQEFRQIFPRPGWVEHDPMEIWNTQLKVAEGVVRSCCRSSDHIAAIGITNQRETTLVWNKSTGKPVYNAIVWQDRRTAPLCEDMKERGLSAYVKNNTGLIIDAYFSATKISWILHNVPGVLESARKGELAFGTVDTWLLWNLSGGRVHATDHSNASRTMIYNINTLSWDQKLLEVLEIPDAMLPEVRPSGWVYCRTDERFFSGRRIPVAGVAGDQQAALFGQGCFQPGTVKSTYGTGSFVLMNTGGSPVNSERLISTIAWGFEEDITYALEGSIFVTGAAVQWLRDALKLIDNASDSDFFARKVEDSGGVYVVPAFAGLGAPHWDMYARGAILGITRGSGKNHLVRATLESLAYQVRDVVDCMVRDSKIDLKEIRVDGGASTNDFLMQFQADMLAVNVVRPKMIESTAWGAATLAGLTAGFWKDRGQLRQAHGVETVFRPTLDEKTRGDLYRGWQKALNLAMAWGKGPS